jgi:hypothetical protein
LFAQLAKYGDISRWLNRVAVAETTTSFCCKAKRDYLDGSKSNTTFPVSFAGADKGKGEA